jgi:hypothetical protein
LFRWDRLPPRDILQCLFAAGLIEFLVAVEGIPGIAHDLAGFRDVSELLGEVEDSHAGFDDLFVGGHE